MAKNPVLYWLCCRAAGPIKGLPHQSLMLRQGHLWGKAWDLEIWNGETGEAERFELPNSIGPLFLMEETRLPT